MGRYLDALKKNKKVGGDYPNKPKELEKGGILGLLGTPPPRFEINRAAEPIPERTGRTVANPLSIEEETAIRAWFTSIGEDDPATIADTLAQCQRDSVGRAYLLKEAAHAQHNSTAPLVNQWLSCGACKHFRRIAIHPHLGHCSRGKPEGTAGLWDSTVRWCAEGAAS